MRSAKVRSQKVSFGTTKWLTYTAVFTALALVMKFAGQALTITKDFKITPIYVIWLIAAAVLGPVGGGVVGFLSDILGALIFPVGAINPLLTLGCTMYGVLAGLCYKYFPVKNHYAKFLFSGIMCTVLVSLLFDSFALWYWCKFYLKLASYADKTFFAYIGASRIMQLAVSAVNIGITLAMVPLLRQLKLLPDLKKKQKQQNIKETAPCPTSL